MPPLVHFDNHKQCLANYGHQSAIYCITHVYIEPNQSSTLWSYLSSFQLYINPNNYRHDVLKRGLCVNDCRRKITSAHQIKERKGAFIPHQPYPNRLLGSSPAFEVEDDVFRDLSACNNLELEEGYGLKGVTVVSFCTSNELDEIRSQDDITDRWWKIFVVALIITVSLGTLIDVLNKPSSGDVSIKSLLSAFSLRKNFQKLTDIENETVLINGVKASFLWAIVIIHTISIRVNFSIFDQYEAECTLNQIGSLIAPVAPMYVSVFIFLNGYLAFYRPYYDLVQGRTFNWRETLLKRLIRLLPAVGVVVFFHASYFSKILSTPQWIEIAQTVRLNCRKNWWTNLLFVNNILNPTEPCVLQSKY